MTTEKYLRRLCWLENTIKSRSEKVEVGRSRATNMVAPTDSDPVQTSAKDKLCEIMSDVVDMDVELQAYVTQYKTIMSQIDNLSGIYAPAYLYGRFAKNKSVNEISRELHVSRSTTYRIHREAIEEFENLYGETYKQEKSFAFLEHFGTL